MGISSIPAPSTASAIPVGKSAIVSTVVSAPHFSTSLSAGSYVVKVNNGGQNYITSWAAPASGISNAQNYSGQEFPLILTTTDTVSLGGGWTFGKENTHRASGTNLAVANFLIDGTTVFYTTRSTSAVSVFKTIGITSQAPTALLTYAVTVDTGAPLSKTSAFGNSIYLLASDTLGTVFRSTNGTTWTTQSAGITISGMTFGSNNNRFVVVSQDSTAGRQISSSTDGITWATRLASVTIPLQATAFGSSTYVAVGDSGTIYSSTDAVTWATRTSPLSSQLLNVVFGNNVFLATGAVNGGTNTDGPNGCISTNGTTWTAVSVNGYHKSAPRYQAIAASGSLTFCNGFFYSYANIGDQGPSQHWISYSADGITWGAVAGGYMPTPTMGVTLGNVTFPNASNIYSFNNTLIAVNGIGAAASLFYIMQMSPFTVSIFTA